MKSDGYTSLPVYKNSLVLKDLSGALAQYFSPEKKVFARKTLGLRSVIAESLAEDASLLPVFIEKASSAQSLNHRMKSTRFISIITKNIISYCNGLEKDGVKEKEYIQLMRQELIVFRQSFKQWRKSLLSDNDRLPS